MKTLFGYTCRIWSGSFYYDLHIFVIMVTKSVSYQKGTSIPIISCNSRKIIHLLIHIGPVSFGLLGTSVSKQCGFRLWYLTFLCAQWNVFISFSLRNLSVAQTNLNTFTYHSKNLMHINIFAWSVNIIVHNMKTNILNHSLTMFSLTAVMDTMVWRLWEWIGLFFLPLSSENFALAYMSWKKGKCRLTFCYCGIVFCLVPLSNLVLQAFRVRGVYSSSQPWEMAKAVDCDTEDTDADMKKGYHPSNDVS